MSPGRGVPGSRFPDGRVPGGPVLGGRVFRARATAVVARLALAGALGWLSCAALEPAAHAQEPAPSPALQEQVAQQLFERARLKWKDADYAGAASLFAASIHESPQPGALILLADCQEHLGKLQSASQAFARAAELADAAGDVDLSQRARTRAAVLAPLIPQLELRVAEPLPPGLLVTLDGVEVPAERLNTPLALDAGEHELQARAPGYADFQAQVTLNNGPSPTPGPQVLALLLEARGAPPLVAQSAPPAELPPAARASSPAPLAPLAAATLGPSGTEQAGSSGLDRRSLAWIAGSVGLVAGAVGLVVIVNAERDYDRSQRYCESIAGRQACYERGLELQRRAQSQANWATVAALVASAGLGVGVYAYVTSDEGSALPNALRVGYEGRF
jgi:hypothetical protein